MRVEAAVVDGVSNGDVSIQGDGAQVHDGRRREQDVQIDPDGTKVGGQGPPVICRRKEIILLVLLLRITVTSV